MATVLNNYLINLKIDFVKKEEIIISEIEKFRLKINEQNNLSQKSQLYLEKILLLKIDGLLIMDKLNLINFLLQISNNQIHLSHKKELSKLQKIAINCVKKERTSIREIIIAYSKLR